MAIKCKKCGYENIDGVTQCAICMSDLSVSGMKVDSKKIIYGDGSQIKQQPPTITQPPLKPPQQIAPLTKPYLLLPDGKKQYLFSTLPTQIGSQGCAVNLSGIQPIHAQVISMNGGFAVEPISDAVMTVNNKIITAMTPLSPSDQIAMGAHTLVYHGPSSQVPPIQPQPQVPVMQAPPQAIQQQFQQLNSLPASLRAWGQPKLSGEIIHIDTPYTDPADFSVSWIFYYLVSGGLFSGSKSSARQQTVRKARLLDSQGKEHAVRIKGNLISGTVSQGDQVALWGIWRNQMLDMHRAYNFRISAIMRLDRFDSPGAKLAHLFYHMTLILIALGVLLILLTAFPR